MKTRKVRRFATLILLLGVCCLALTAIIRHAPTPTWTQLEQLKARLTQRGGQTWFYGEQLADDVRSRLASRFSTFRNMLLPVPANEPPMPTATDSVHLSDDLASNLPDSGTLNHQGAQP